MKIEIYSTPTCHYCDLAKKFFKENGLEYTTFDVKADLEKRKEMVEISEQLGVPVITIDGKVFTGFDEGALKKALKL